MAISAKQVTITTSPTLIHSVSDGDGDKIHVHTPTGGQDVFLGGSDVTTSTGFLLTAGDRQVEMELDAGDAIYGVVAATTSTVYVLVSS